MVLFFDLVPVLQVTDAGIEGLKAAPLVDLSLYKCRELSGTGIEQVLAGKLFTALNIGCCRGFKVDQIEVLRGMPLTSLNLAGLNLTAFLAAGLPDILREMRLLCFDISRSWTLTDAQLAELVEGQMLVEVNLNNCPRLSLDALSALRVMPVKVLNLGYCRMIGFALARHVSMMAALTSLDLEGWTQLKDGRFEDLRYVPLTSLSIKGCSDLTRASLEIVQRMPLKYLNAAQSGLTHAMLLGVGFQGVWENMKRR